MVDEKFYQRLGPLPLASLLNGLDVELPNNIPDIDIQNAAPADTAGAFDITYFEKSKRSPKLSTCKAFACFVYEEYAEYIKELGCIPIISQFPRADFAHVLESFYSTKHYGPNSLSGYEDVEIGTNVVIGTGAKIGSGTKIGPNSVIGPGVCLGKSCNIGANVVIEFASLGDNCNVHHGAVIGGTGFGIAVGATGGFDIPHIGSVVIGDHVSIGCQTTIDRAMFGETQIGNGCKFDNLVQIAHNNIIGPNCMFAAQVGIAGSCNIGAGVIMGGQAGVADHIMIGDGATLAANGATMHNIPAGEMWSGCPALPIRQHMRTVSVIRRLAKKKTSAPKGQN